MIFSTPAETALRKLLRQTGKHTDRSKCDQRHSDAFLHKTGAPGSTIARDVHQHLNYQPPSSPHAFVLRWRVKGVLLQARKKSLETSRRLTPHTPESSEDRAANLLSFFSSVLLAVIPQFKPSHLVNTGRRPPTKTSPRVFDARTAAVACRTVDGYVSFANVEGLGSPTEDNAESITVNTQQHHTWSGWWAWMDLKIE